MSVVLTLLNCTVFEFLEACSAQAEGIAKA